MCVCVCACVCVCMCVCVCVCVSVCVCVCARVHTHAQVVMYCHGKCVNTGTFCTMQVHCVPVCTEAYFGHTCYMLQVIVKQEQL